MKIVPAVADDISLSEAERSRGRAFATALSMRVLSRTWQMLLKGVAEVKDAARPIAAAEMVLVRIAYAADLPTPDEVIREVQQNGGASARGNGSAASSAPQPTTPRSSAPTPSAPRSVNPDLICARAQCGNVATRRATRGARAFDATRRRSGARR